MTSSQGLNLQTVRAISYLLFPFDDVEDQHPRDEHKVPMREIRVWLMRQCTGASLHEITAAAHENSHATVTDALNRVQKKFDDDPRWCELLHGLAHAVVEIARLNGVREPAGGGT